MIKLILLLLLSLLTACTTSYPANSYGVESDFSVYINRFYQDLESAGLPKIDVSYIKFYAFTSVTPGTNFVGICSKGSSERKISILRTNPEFEMYTYLIFVHEIGHCAYNKTHSADMSTIMYPYVNNENYSKFEQLEQRLIMIKEMIQ